MGFMNQIVFPNHLMKSCYQFNSRVSITEGTHHDSIWYATQRFSAMMATVNGSGISIPNRWIERGCPQSWMLKSSRWQLRAGIDAISRKNFLLFSFQNFFQAKWYSLKQFSFIYFLISWTTWSICGISKIKNAMIPITKIPVMTVARVSFVINYFHT